MRLALTALLALALLTTAAPVASADHTCDMMPPVDPVRLAGCLAVCSADHLLAGQLPECEFTH